MSPAKVNVASWCCVLAVLALGVPRALAVDDEGLLEVDGDIVDGVDPGCSKAGVPTAPTSGVGGEPDWTNIFETGSSPNGTVTGHVDPLPEGGVIASFEADDLSQSNAVDCTTYGPTSNKNIDEIDTWQFQAGNVPPKDDISNIYAYLAEAEDGRRFVYIGLERIEEGGDSHVDFEFNQNDVGLELNDPDDPCSGGHFTGTRANGDFIVTIDYIKGGGIGQVRVFRYEGTPAVLNQTPIFDSGALTGVQKFCNPIGGTIPADSLCAANSGGASGSSIDGGPWANFDRHGATVTCIPPNGFTELGIFLDAFLLPGRECFTSIIAKTRSSQSITSELKDFAIVEFDICSDISGSKSEAADETCGAGEDGIIGNEDDVTTPLQNWEIVLLDADGDLVTTDGNGNPLQNPTCTDAQGFYEFKNLTEGVEYKVCEIIPDRLTEDEGPEEDLNCNGIEGEPKENFDWVPCLPAGADGELGSDVTPPRECCDTLGGKSFCYADAVLLNGDTERNFRNRKQVIVVTLGGTKFCDENGDGVRDPEDEGLEGFCIVLEDGDGNVIEFQTTDAGGNYNFTVECARDYTIEEDLTGAACGSDDKTSGWSPTTSAHTVSAPCDVEEVTDLDFGNASKPTIDCGTEDVTLDNDSGKCTARFCFTPSATNECGAFEINCTATNDVVLSSDGGTVCGDFPAGCEPGTVTEVTCTVTTDAGLEASCSFTVTVIDNEAPVITCPADASFECDAVGDAGSATAVDNCDASPDISSSDEVTPGDCPQERTIRRTWTARDACGNESSCVQTIQVVDTTAPVITCPADATVACGAPTEFLVTAEDNCDDTPVIECTFSDSFNPDRFTVTELGNGRFRLTLTASTVVTVTCTAMDACGNTSDSCTFTVSATCSQACSPGYWRNHPKSWCKTGFNPTLNHCFTGPATKFADAFGITNFSSTQIPASFNKNITLLQAVSLSGGTFNQVLFQGSAALLSGSHPDVSFPASPAAIKQKMRDAFAGVITFNEAKAYFTQLNQAEKEGGCPLR